MDADFDGPLEQDAKPIHTNGSDWVHHLPKDVSQRDLPMRDISMEAVWTLSSCKAAEGYGIFELLDESVDKYWQSDGPQPHTVTIEFARKTDISFLLLYLDFKNDESYTPSKVIVYMGSSLMHLDDGRERSFNDPVGWQVIDLRNAKGQPSRAFVIQLQVVHNHQNGRDTHIRHIRVAGPSRSRFEANNRLRIGNPLQVDDFRSSPPRNNASKMFGSMSIR